MNHAFCPNERSRGFIVAGDEGVDVGDEFWNALEGCAVERFAGQDREPDFNLVEPGRMCRGVMKPHVLVTPGLAQAVRPVKIHEGEPMVLPEALTADEIKEVAKLIADAKYHSRAASRKQYRIWADQHVELMVARGTTRDDAEKTVKQWAKGFLLPDAIVEFVDPKFGFTSIREIMANPVKYEGQICHHPIEGRDYVAPGKFFADSMSIFTHGHGGQLFHLRLDYISLVNIMLAGPEGDAFNIYKRYARQTPLDKNERKLMMNFIEERTKAGSLHR
jgi:hypothetical protein